jgi:hypothetical protein
MRQLLLVSLIVAMPCWGLSPTAKRRLTFAAVAAAQFLDVHSSLGKREANPLLRGPDGRFSAARGAAFKLGILAGLFAVQELQPRPFWSWVNVSYAGFSTTVAIRNYGVRATNPPPSAPVGESGLAAAGGLAK